jgi:hypothetical protein
VILILNSEGWEVVIKLCVELKVMVVWMFEGFLYFWMSYAVVTVGFLVVVLVILLKLGFQESRLELYSSVESFLFIE